MRVPLPFVKVGVALCFFGGTYVASLAAVEAFRQMGWRQSFEDASYVFEQMVLVKDASEKDDKVDADGDGVADVDALTPTDLAQRKVTLAMLTVDEPGKLKKAFGGLWTAYVGVVATLRFEFARTTAIALGLVEMASVPATAIFAPFLIGVLGEKLRHWVQTMIDTVLTIIAVAFAWYMQMIISAFYSGIRGGKLFAVALMDFLSQQARTSCPHA
jgi:hypothetical protein